MFNTFHQMYQPHPIHLKRTHIIPFTWKKTFIIVLILWNSQIFAATVGNPIGIKYFQEVFYVLLVFFSTSYIFSQVFHKKSINKIDMAVYFLAVFAVLYSAAVANIKFQQPLIYGIIEERRTFAFMIYFPLIWAFRNNVLSVRQMFTWIFVSGIICSVLTIGVATGFVPKLKDVDAWSNELREGRFAIGQIAISVSALVVTHRMSRPHFMKDTLSIFLLLFFLSVILVVVQSRQIIISTLAAIILLHNTRKLIFFASPILATIILWISQTTSILSFANKFGVLFTQITSNVYLTQSARAHTISSILLELGHGAWFGSGSLSSLWRGGFSAIYGSNFYLADVGIFGTAYKFGLFSIPILYVYLYLQIKNLGVIKKHPEYRLIMAAWMQLLIIWPVAAIIEYRGFMSGLLIAATIGCAMELKQNRQECIISQSLK